MTHLYVITKSNTYNSLKLRVNTCESGSWFSEIKLLTKPTKINPYLLSKIFPEWKTITLIVSAEFCQVVSPNNLLVFLYVLGRREVP